MSTDNCRQHVAVSPCACRMPTRHRLHGMVLGLHGHATACSAKRKRCDIRARVHAYARRARMPVHLKHGACLCGQAYAFARVRVCARRLVATAWAPQTCSNAEFQRTANDTVLPHAGTGGGEEGSPSAAQAQEQRQHLGG
eukprot:1207611-Alexandrium_andersonii.AAC.1